jgi:hypothetical protein
VPDTRQSLGRAIVDGLTGLIYEDPITLWGTVLAILVTWLLSLIGVDSAIVLGAVLFVGVWLAIGRSLSRARPPGSTVSSPDP